MKKPATRYFFYFFLLLRYVYHRAMFSLFSGQKHPRVFVHITRKDMGHEGRYLFLVHYFFAEGKCDVALVREIWDFVSYYRMGKYGRLLFRLAHPIFLDKLPLPDRSAILISDSMLTNKEKKQWGKFVYIDYEIAKTDRDMGTSAYKVMQCTMHPRSYASHSPSDIFSLRTSQRNIRLFFSGNTTPKAYSRNPVTKTFNLLPRIRVIEAIRALPKDTLLVVGSQNKLKEVIEGGYEKRFVFIDSDTLRIPQEKWLEVLSRCDFFLCAPGSHMPYSHNAIEAMAMGTIPLINYPEWFIPPLEHKVNCIAFSDEKDLISKINEVRGMGTREIEVMRENVIRYYDTFLSLESLRASVLETPHRELVLFYNVEDPDILRKLNKGSVLFGKR